MSGEQICLRLLTGQQHMIRLPHKYVLSDDWKQVWHRMKVKR